MPATHGTRRRRSALAAAAVLAALTVTATACGPTDDNAAAKPDASADGKPDGSARDGLDLSLPKDLPTSLEDLDKWRDGGWRNWDEKDWLRDAADFVNPYIKDLWKPERMHEAESGDKEVTEEDIAAASTSADDPAPRAVRAQRVATPYHRNAAPVGKVFFDTPKGPAVCSGTVVKDPRNPGKSNLVATAGHCVHGGKGKGWFRNIMFVPSYNDRGRPANQIPTAPKQQISPYKQWWATWAQTTGYWIERGDAVNGAAGAAQDFAVLQVKAEDGSGKSLEETVGASLRINFRAPRPGQLSGLSSYGYPAAPPYDGALMHTCTDRPGRLTVDPTQPQMYRIGCTMTGGTSGGGMFVTGADGKAELVSVNSIGPRPATWLAGPYLGGSAKGVFDAISKRFAGKN
ncbi:trypsin-like serine peptidase [Streptomyces alkaliterrae]|uniref:V8-like Glu-specific endopeptidase n=1 Tax=Streptomyces alkaliterrae TaxID=2213162 RepID=A0A5P0YP31_9ACTN|nr:hypothetical protein [Streptomyces alkaliterrae]MBB1253013.1 hypothetical protein [Streptomyces alkaliterrae]MBB1260278.1 hypothetical protein [Streptomyces alkaliterrae]MQS02015.1 hypothetical protein [Streptomyces alkaliterrae]